MEIGQTDFCSKLGIFDWSVPNIDFDKRIDLPRIS